MRRALVLIVFSRLAVPAVAAANPRPLPALEPYETLVEDKLELEQRVDAVPVRLPPSIPAGPDAGWRLRAELQTELRLGWSDRLELGVSVGLRQDAAPGTPSLRLAGFSQRARFRFAEAGDWPVDVAIQATLSELHDGAAAAERAIVSWRRGALLVLANFEVEQRYGAGSGEWRHAYVPAGGVAYEITPSVSVGAEYLARGRLDRPRTGPSLLDDPEDPGADVFHYAGPAALVQRGRMWLSAGAHVRLDLLGGLGARAAEGDRFGRLWVRALLGLEL